MTTKVTLLGTAGGPGWGRQPDGTIRSGVSTAIEVDDRVYLIDTGYGAGGQLNRAGYTIDQLRGIFYTHMHSDHLVDLPGIMLFSMWWMPLPPTQQIPVYGPASGVLPRLWERATAEPTIVAPTGPMPGIDETMQRIEHAFANDLNDRAFDTLRPSPLTWFDPREIVLPPEIGFDAHTANHPPMEPLEIYRDEHIAVSATLVDHFPTAPAFGFRVDTSDGSVVVSGDTAPSSNLARLARGADLLIHEAFDFDFIAGRMGPEESWSDTLRSIVAHHRRAHSSVADAVRIAEEAGVRTLALNHLAPSSRPREAWEALIPDTEVQVVVPDDLHQITLG